LHVKLIVNDGTTISPEQTEGFNTFLRNMRDWNVTLYGRIDESSDLIDRFLIKEPAKEPVPDVFQNAFKDGELDV
jgi:hypothetical protein